MLIIVGKCLICIPILAVMYILFQMAKEGYNDLTNLKPEPEKPEKTEDLLQNEIDQTEYNIAMIERNMDKGEGETLVFTSVMGIIIFCILIVMIIIIWQNVAITV